MTVPAPTITTDVLVVGAGPAGLATAVSALRHGAGVLVVERRAGISTVPRATGVSTRTMEIFRSWGVDDAVRAGRVDCEPRIAVHHTLAEPPLTEVPIGYPSMREALAVSPAHPVICPQDHIEPLLVEQIRRLGGAVRFGTALVGLRLDAGGYGVRGELVAADGTAVAAVRARFVVGADGTCSPVRTALGIGLERLGTLGEFAQVQFRPDLSALLGRRLHALNVVEHPDATGMLLPVGDGRWTYSQRWFPERGQSLADYTPQRWVALLRTATGLPRLRPQLLAARPFTMAAAVATRYRSGSGFLVGDAAHRMTPIAGIGMNTAIHDGHELGWRLAWVLRGLAGEALLDSYAAEREPAGRANALRSLREGGAEPGDGLPVDIGRGYRSAVIAADGAPSTAVTRLVQQAAPGERAPHVWVRRHGRRCSVLDLFEDRLTVLAGRAGDGWTRAADRLTGMPLQVHVAGRGLSDEHGDLSRTYRLGERSAVLVRPDGVVAWRHDGSCADPVATLAAAVALATGQSTSEALAV
ncbi:MAG TPA: FAD-dependent monooxygenase [Pseudonocardia sp.]|nr:FAD-dependent monooxygenase [Pseudonocardia sp.]